LRALKSRQSSPGATFYAGLMLSPRRSALAYSSREPLIRNGLLPRSEWPRSHLRLHRTGTGFWFQKSFGWRRARRHCHQRQGFRACDRGHGVLQSRKRSWICGLHGAQPSKPLSRICSILPLLMHLANKEVVLGMNVVQREHGERGDLEDWRNWFLSERAPALDVGIARSREPGL